MTHTTSLKFTSVALFTLSMLACGKDPYSGGIGTTLGGAGGGTGLGGAGGTSLGGAGGTSLGGAGGIGPGGAGGDMNGGDGGQTTTGGSSGTVLPFPSDGFQFNASFTIDVSPIRALDLVFMIDNSPSMAPKQLKLKEQFGTLLAALKDPLTGDLPDLHVAIINSDLGTGGAYPKDSTCGPNAANDFSPYGNMGHFQMPKATECGVTDPNAKFLVYERDKPVNFTGDINDVFKCLASGIGTSGCGQEHQLQAFEWALINMGDEIGNKGQIDAFLRREATLGLVFLTDEDDCSAALNPGMFGTNPGKSDLSGESASLRCATRAHQCGGSNLTNNPPGYPTTASFSADFATCMARTDSCPNPTNITDPATMKATNTADPALGCSPLKDVKLLADEIKAIKMDPRKVVVAGIFGWPTMGQTPAPYKIDLIPNPAYQPGTTAKEKVYDLWPVCYDPNHMPADLNTYDRNAVGNGATPGVRDSAFIDQFGDNGLKYSICEPNFADAMTGLGVSIAKKMQSLCLDAKLVDADLNAPGLQPDCRVNYAVPVRNATGKLVNWSVNASPLPPCPVGATRDSVETTCWQLLSDKAKCPTSGALINILRSKEDIDVNGPLEAGTVAQVRCNVCAYASGDAPAGCDYTL